MLNLVAFLKILAIIDFDYKDDVYFNYSVFVWYVWGGHEGVLSNPYFSINFHIFPQISIFFHKSP